MNTRQAMCEQRDRFAPQAFYTVPSARCMCNERVCTAICKQNMGHAHTANQVHGMSVRMNYT